MADTTAGHWGVGVSEAGGNTSKTKYLDFLSLVHILHQFKIRAPGPLYQRLVLI